MSWHSILAFTTHYRYLLIGILLIGGPTWFLAGEIRKYRRRRAPEFVDDVRDRMREEARWRAPELPPGPTPEPQPEPANEPAAEPVEHTGADATWSPAAELAAVGDGVLNRAALEEKTQAFIPVVPTDKQVETAMWGARWRSADQKLEAERRRITAWMATLDPELADIMRANDLRDLELHEAAVADALAALDEPSGEHHTVLDMERVTVGAR